MGSAQRAGASGRPVGPASPVPVAPTIGVGRGDGHHVAGAGGDVPVAARAEIRLGRLVGLDVADPDAGIVEGGIHDRSAEGGPGHEGHRHHDGPHDDHDVGDRAALAVERVEAHGRQYRRVGVRSTTDAAATRCDSSDRRPVRSAAVVVGRRALPVVVLVTALAGGACADADPGIDVSGDPVLESGQDVYAENCARCHGTAGGGGVGPKLADGAVAEALPDIEDHIAVIRDGRGTMPAWEGTLDPDEIRAVARYEREAL